MNFVDLGPDPEPLPIPPRSAECVPDRMYSTAWQRFIERSSRHERVAGMIVFTAGLHSSRQIVYAGVETVLGSTINLSNVLRQTYVSDVYIKETKSLKLGLKTILRSMVELNSCQTPPNGNISILMQRALNISIHPILIKL